ncbi:MAG: hypothetical protein ABH857_04525 [Elusimicrobiota bacterium]
MKKQVKCPNCKELFNISENKKYADCPYCKEEFAVSLEKDSSRDLSKNNDAHDAWERLFKKKQ